MCLNFRILLLARVACICQCLLYHFKEQEQNRVGGI